jgi:nicotinamide-nucleotide amidase
MNAEIVAIGSELLLGQIVDTNSAWMAQRLASVGVNLFYKTIVGDNPGRMLEAITAAMERSDVVITSGGIGPTQDDLTREIVAKASSRELVMEPELLAQIEARFRRRGFIMSENNDRQAYIPKGSIPVENPNGTAPSFIVENPEAIIICLPGVPFEMKWLFDNEVIPYLRRKFDLSEAIYSRVLKVADMGESGVDELVGHLIANSSNPTVGVLAHPGQVDVRITAKAASQDEADVLIAPLEKEVRGLLGDHVFATGEQTMPDIVGELLRSRNLTVASFEGLTGGLIAQQLQEADGPRFLQGTVSQRESTLQAILGANGADAEMPTEPEALTGQLASAVRAGSGSDLGLAVLSLPDDPTPSSGTSNTNSENLRAGNTYIAVASAQGISRRVYNFAGPGLPDRTRAALHALDLLRVTVMQS